MRLDKFLKLSPGGSELYLEEGMEIIETEPSINLEELISKYIFESDNQFIGLRLENKLCLTIFG